MRFEDKTVLVTGASRGIGAETARAFAHEGARVAVNYLQDADNARAVTDAIAAQGRKALAWAADVRDAEAVNAMVAEVESQLGPIDVLVNNAGIVSDTLVTFMSEQQWSSVLDTNLKGAFHCIRAVGKGMVRRKGGRIVNVSSVAGLTGDLMRANYASAKAGMIGLTRAVAREFARSGVTVNAVAPGIVDTDLIAGMDERTRERAVERIPARRFGRAPEVASAILFLASDDAAYITGQVLSIDGGLHM